MANRPRFGLEPAPETLPPGTYSLEVVGRLLREALEVGLSVELKVTGSSMSPFITSGDVVTVRPTSNRSIRLGEVVALQPDEKRLLIHRVIRRSRSGVVTRGDAGSPADPPAQLCQILGVVQEVQRGGRRVRLGLGPERILLALLSRHGLLRPLRRLASRFKSSLRLR